MQHPGQLDVAAPTDLRSTKGRFGTPTYHPAWSGGDAATTSSTESAAAGSSRVLPGANMPRVPWPSGRDNLHRGLPISRNGLRG